MREPKHCPLLSLRSRSIVSVNNHYGKLWTSLIKNKWKLLQNKLWANFSTANLNRISVRHYVLLKSFDCCNRENLLFVSQFILVEYRMAFILFCCGFQRSQRTPFFAQLEGNHVARLQKHRGCSANWSMVSITDVQLKKKSSVCICVFCLSHSFSPFERNARSVAMKRKVFPSFIVRSLCRLSGDVSFANQPFVVFFKIGLAWTWHNCVAIFLYSQQGP